jgi:predicted nucleotidyltransferase
MITERDKDIIIQCAKKFNVSYIILFGSSIHGESIRKDREANDIDIGVKGIEPRLFFKFYAELFKHLSKPVDLVDLSKKSLFNELVEETGIRIYG